MVATTVHEAVLLEESMLALELKPGGRYVDGTLGGGTHTRTILERSAPDGRVLSLDVDHTALARAQEQFQSFGTRFQAIERNFRFLDQAVQEAGFGPCDGVLLDLGFSSDELLDPKKGLSFLQEGSLDMRLGPQSNEDGLTAADIVNGWSKQELSTLLQEYGEERFAWKIAEAICKARKSARIVGTLDLVSVIKMAVPASYEHGRIHPATRTFQALRMAVNDEIPALKQAVQAAASILRPGGRCAIITFHSIEDRVVKHLFQNEELWEPVAKKPIAPTEAECERNPRARSAKLRVARRM
jgi:16S rRNA (cytosine1402-N4)-methyltransferase